MNQHCANLLVQAGVQATQQPCIFANSFHRQANELLQNRLRILQAGVSYDVFGKLIQGIRRKPEGGERSNIEIIFKNLPILGCSTRYCFSDKYKLKI